MEGEEIMLGEGRREEEDEKGEDRSGYSSSTLMSPGPKFCWGSTCDNLTLMPRGSRKKSYFLSGRATKGGGD